MAGRILIIDASVSQRALLKSRLADDYYQVECFGDPSDPLIPTRAAHVDLVFLAAEPYGKAARALLQRLKSGRRTAAVPVIVLLGDSRKTPASVLGQGADDVLVRPFSDIALQARVRALVRLKRMHDELLLRDTTARAFGFGETPMPPPILPVPLEVLHFRPIPHEAGSGLPPLTRCDRISISEVHSEAELVSRCKELPMALVLLRMTERRSIEAGFQAIGWLRAEPETRQTPVVMLTAPEGEPVAARGLDLRAQDFVTTDTPREELIARLRCQARRHLMMLGLRENLAAGVRDAVTDPLTRLMNRRYAELHIPRLIEQSRAAGHDFALAVLDLDRFKRINDEHGHPVGDKVLVEAADRIRQSVRGADLVARQGGEEFLVALPDAPRAEAWCIAERIRDSIAERPFVVDAAEGGQLSVTASVGVAVTTPMQNIGFEELVSQADAALYRAKRDGRNRVSIGTPTAA